MKISKYIPLLLLCSSLYLIFSLKTDAYFSVDDFSVLAYFDTHSFTDILKFPVTGDMFGFHKMLGYLLLYALHFIYGTNQYPYIFVLFILHTTNILLVFILSARISKNNHAAGISALIFSHYYLSYFSNVHEYLVTFFGLLTIYLFELKHRRYALLCFILALFSKEIAIFTPIFMFAIVPRKIWRHLRPFVLVSGGYLLYQSVFALTGTLIPRGNFIYEFTASPPRVLSKLSTFYPLTYLVFFALSAFVARNKKVLVILGVVLISILPFSMLATRTEVYYNYFPSAFLSIGISLLLARVRPFIALSVIAVLVLLLGGRAVFPPIARQSYPNWEKDSITQVTERVTDAMQQNPNAKTISLEGVNLMRDARLMLVSGTTHLFVKEDTKQRYRYNEAENSVSVERY